MSRRTNAGLLSLLLASGAVASEVEPAAAPSAGTEEARAPQLAWLEGLDAGLEEARRRKAPLLVRVVADWCVWCRKLDVEIARDDVQQALGRWTLVELDADKAAADVRKLGVGPIPALRVLDAAGRTLASHDGYLPADELLAWLDEQFDAAGDSTADVLVAAGPIEGSDVTKLVRELGRREPARREAAVRRLLPHADRSAREVAAQFKPGRKLAARLEALELLRSWQAPVEGLDPWRPETLTAERIERLVQWAGEYAAAHATTADTAPPSATPPLAPAELVAAQADIERLISADAAEAEAICARLARHGRALLDEVYDRLRQADDDRARERLTWLRYSLVARDALALSWPGGLARLASADAAIRNRAADELAERAVADDEPLLLELFSDPEPLVRELALRTLHRTGGSRAGNALARLLDDPEPNVRAAVLKQFAEHPSAKIVKQVAEYVARETDPDLLVHAVRVLRAVKSADAVECLTTLLRHDSWRVRAESAEAIGECLHARDAAVANELKADAHVALIDLLDDADGFVVSRALQGLRNVDIPDAVKPVAKAVEKHPELVKVGVETMLGGQSMHAKAEEQFAAWMENADPRLRAAALVGLRSLATDALGPGFRKLISDPDAGVRTTVAEQLFQWFEAQRPAEGDGGQVGEEDLSGDDAAEKDETESVESEAGQDADGASENGDLVEDGPAAKPAGYEPSAAESSAAPRKVLAGPGPLEAWLAGVRSGKGRKAWTNELVEPLIGMLAAESPAERAAAAAALVPLGRDDVALPALASLVDADAAMAADAVRVLPWLLWKERAGWFSALAARRLTSEVRAELGRLLVVLPDPRAGELLWQELARDGLTPAEAQGLLANLLRAYELRAQMHPMHYQRLGPSAAPRSAKRAVAELAGRYAGARAPWQRVVALAVLCAADLEAAAQAARKIYDEPAEPDEVRLDAFQVVLLACPRADAETSALAALAGGSPGARRLALIYLARGPEALDHLRGNPLDLSEVVAGRQQAYLMVGESEKAHQLPKGIDHDALRPFLRDADPEVAAYAAYVLAMLGGPDGLPALVAQWRSRRDQAQVWDPLVERAIAALDDAEHLDVLQAIYESLDRAQDTYRIRELYWNIRSIAGPEAIKLRKRIRDDVGMDNLR